MKHEPLTFAEAQVMRNEYEDLKGEIRLAASGHFEVIEDVVIAPYSKVNTLLFISLYKTMEDSTMALAFCSQSQYDVILILREVAPLGDGYEDYLDIRNYLQEHRAPMHSYL